MRKTSHYRTFNRYHLFVSKWLSVYLHVYFADIELPYHDHPWSNLTVRLWGRFVESIIPNYMSLERGQEKIHINPRFVFRRATTAHRMKALNVDKRPLITLFITGPAWNTIGGQA